MAPSKCRTPLIGLCLSLTVSVMQMMYLPNLHQERHTRDSVAQVQLRSLKSRSADLRTNESKRLKSTSGQFRNGITASHFNSTEYAADSSINTSWESSSNSGGQIHNTGDKHGDQRVETATIATAVANYSSNITLFQRTSNEHLPSHALGRNHTAWTFVDSLEWAADHLQILFPKNTSNLQTVTSDDVESRLLNATVRYYVYPEHLLLLDDRYHMRNLIDNNLKTLPKIYPTQYIEDCLWEILILNTLLNHSLRTDLYETADLFLIPVPFSTMYFDKANNQSGLTFDRVRLTLQNSTAFQQGKPHVLVSTTFPLFNKHYPIDRRFRQLYDAVKMVSVARPDNLLAIRYAHQNNVTPTNGFRGFDHIMATFAPETEYQFSIGLGYEALHLPLITPSWEKFEISTFYIFYHIRPTSFHCNSTDIRRAPILNVSSPALPLSSIGYNIDKTRWKREYGDSKFCLVVRGDTPHSHALFNAVKVGCIPVVISDWYPLYAPPFPSTLDMRDFCIFIGEDKFMSNPELALQSLQDIPRDMIESKLRGLEWAQQVMMMDHPRSLFVPAFVREAMTSFSRPASQLLIARDGKATMKATPVIS